MDRQPVGPALPERFAFPVYVVDWRETELSGESDAYDAYWYMALDGRLKSLQDVIKGHAEQRERMNRK